MTKCCKCGVETRQTISANHPNADTYCAAHGVCPRCGGSVAAFEQRGAHWFCPCMIRMQDENERILRELAQKKKQDTEKKLAQFVIPRANKRRVRKVS